MSNNQESFDMQQGAIFETANESLLKPAQTRVQKKSNKKLILIVSVFIALLVILLLVLVMKRKPQQQIIQEAIEEEEVVKLENLSPLEKQLKEVEQELDLADPSAKKIPFPQVNMNIRIEAEYDD